MPRRASLVVFLGLASAMMMIVGISAGAAQEDSQSKRAEVGDAQERLMQARMDQSTAYESYKSALGELNGLDGEISSTETELQTAEEELAQAQQELEERASQVYKSGNVAFMDVLVGVDDFSEFATRLDLWTKLLQQERIEFEDVREARDELQAQKDLLETQRAQRAETVESAIIRKEQAENSEADAQAYLDSLSGELRALIKEDQARRAEEARANAEKLRAQFAAEAPVEVAQEVPEQQLSLQAKAPAQQEAAPQPDPEVLAQQEEAERLVAERRAAAEQARADQAEAERLAALAAKRADQQQQAEQRREAQQRAAEARAARVQAEQAAIEQAAAELAAQQAADQRAERRAEARQQRQAELAAQEQYEADQAAALEAEAAEADQAAALEAEAAEAAVPPAGTTTPSGSGAPQTAPTGSAPSSSASGDAVVAEAAKYLGTPYVLGGVAECVPGQIMDCNCLTATAFAAFGIYLPEGPLESQMAYGTPVSGPPQAGDLLAWSEDGSGYITHLGIAMGDGTTLHASAYAGFVVSGTPIDSIPGYMGAVRLL